MGANPVQIEVGDFDEAIEIVEDEVAESKFTNSRACFSCSVVKTRTDQQSGCEFIDMKLKKLDSAGGHRWKLAGGRKHSK